MNYILPRDHPTIATIPVGALVGGSTGASTGPDPVIVEPRQHVAATPQIKSLGAVEFKKHEKKWVRDTRYSSSLTDKYLHPS